MIRLANIEYVNKLLDIDSHIGPKELYHKINQSQIFVYEKDLEVIGLLRYSLFWDQVPFINLIIFKEKFRGKGFGKELMFHFEDEIIKQNKTWVMTSTLACETAQHFYRILGYVDSGSLLVEKEGLEIIFKKDLA